MTTNEKLINVLLMFGAGIVGAAFLGAGLLYREITSWLRGERVIETYGASIRRDPEDCGHEGVVFDTGYFTLVVTENDVLGVSFIAGRRKALVGTTKIKPKKWYRIKVIRYAKHVEVFISGLREEMHDAP